MDNKFDNHSNNLNNNTSFLKCMSYPEIAKLCESLRTDLLASISKYGGHLSSNLGIVEVTVALHRVFDFPTDKLIFDVGHQSYIHKLLTGRSLDNIGLENGVARFQKIIESPFDPYEAGHSSTSISAAEGFAIARDKNKENYNIVCVIGDASIASGLSFEALNNIGIKDHKVIIVLNDNDMSISQPKGNLSNYFRKISSDKLYNILKKQYKESLTKSKYGTKLYSFTTKIKDFAKRILVRDTTLFEKFGLTYIGPVDGHNVKALEKAFIRAKNTTKSTIIHVRTIKGKGYKYSENDSIGKWHGVAPFDIETGTPLNSNNDLVSWSKFFSGLTKEMMNINPSSYLIVPATLNGSGLEDTFATYPDRCIDVGIAEEHAITLAGSLSLNNLHPIVTIYSTFLQRSYDEISHDCARFKTGLTLLIDRAGLVGQDGETHQGIYDVGFLSTIPNTIVTMPTNMEEAKYLYFESFKHKEVFAIRYPREFIDNKCNLETKHDYSYGRFDFVTRDKDNNLIIVGVGPNSNKVFQKLNDKNIYVTYAKALYLNMIDDADIDELVKYKKILIYDSYGIEQGFAQNLKSKLIDKQYKGKVYTKCLPTEFIKHGTIQFQLKKYELDIDSIISFIENIL